MLNVVSDRMSLVYNVYIHYCAKIRPLLCTALGIMALCKCICAEVHVE